MASDGIQFLQAIDIHKNDTNGRRHTLRKIIAVYHIAVSVFKPCQCILKAHFFQTPAHGILGDLIFNKIG